METEFYSSPFKKRYASEKMLYIFSDENKFKLWRKLWLVLAEEQKKLGLNISDNQIQDLKENIDNIDFEQARSYEKKFKHDVMAHIHTYGDVAKSASAIIHLGATSAFVGGNADVLIISDAIDVIINKLQKVMYNLSVFSKKYAHVATLGFTHYQPAQITTVGKRSSLWLYDFYLDYNELVNVKKNLKMRGVKGTTGTQASYLNLFNDDKQKVKELDINFTKRFGFESVTVCGQTYTRKQDSIVISALKLIAESAHKMTNDIRLLQNLKEIEESFSKDQIGSSAMAYKKNPMKSERVASLSKFLISLSLNTSLVSMTQWFERTLDDSANRRLTISESFLCADSILNLLITITNSLKVNTKIIELNLNKYLPFMITENIIMQSVKNGADRQEVHEIIRQNSIKAQNEMAEGKENMLLSYLLKDDRLLLNEAEINSIMKPDLYIGRSVEQVDELTKKVKKVLPSSFEDFKDVEI